MNHIFEISQKIGEVLSKSKTLHEKHSILHSRIQNIQSFVTFVGETSSGKSTLINGLLKDNLLLAGANPITGSVTQIVCKDIEKQVFCVINKDATLEHIDKALFLELSQNPDDDLLRLLVETPVSDKRFFNLNIFDTPGFNSINIDHEEVLNKFIPDSDVIVFVVSYRVGFGQQEFQFMKTIENIINLDKSLPVLLVVNRCPDGVTLSDRRIEEIISHASDTLHRKLETYLINSVISENSYNIFPYSELLWNRINEISNSKERLDAIHRKIVDSLIGLSDYMISDYDGKLLSLKVKPEDIFILEAEIMNIETDLEEAFKIVDKYLMILKNNVPKLLDKEIEKVIKAVKEEVNSSDRLIGAESCLRFLESHTIPFALKDLSKNIESFIYETFEQMDKELSEMANKVFKRLEINSNSLEFPEMSELLKNITIKLGIQLAKSSAFNSISLLGGVGGAAAGTGNLVKMAVSRTWRLFSEKSLGREVYTQIGKIFTKKFMQKLNVFVLISTEIISIVCEANTWQNKMVAEIDKKIKDASKKVKTEFLDKSLPEYEINNKKQLEDIYESIKTELQSNIDNIKSKIDLNEQEELKSCINLLNDYKKELESL